MPYLIDGHNLIPRVRGMSLGAPDDELKLVVLLRTFASRAGRRVTVYFDRGAPGSSRETSRTAVTVRFVSMPDTADAAIQRHLRRLGGDARNWTVVSSDAEVRRAALRAGARSQSSQDFARMLIEAPARSAEKPEPPTSPEALQEWASLFAKPKRNPRSNRR